jgi:hypothetical protein
MKEKKEKKETKETYFFIKILLELHPQKIVKSTGVFEEIFEVNRLLLHMATYQFQVKDAL